MSERPHPGARGDEPLRATGSLPKPASAVLTVNGESTRAVISFSHC